MKYPFTFPAAVMFVFGFSVFLSLFCPLLFPCPVEAAALDGNAGVIWNTGDITVFALRDQAGEMPVERFSGPATPQERNRYFPNGKAPAGINAFLIRWGTQNFLVDAGYGTAGKSLLPQALAATGAGPDTIDFVLLTHMHPDHIGGLLHEGKRAFPRAKILVSTPELAYWTDLARKDPNQSNAAMVKAVSAAYGSDFLPPFTLGASLFGDLPSRRISSVDAAGHTPGHSAFLVENRGSKLLIIGDLMHAAALQFPLPDECASFDQNVPAAVASRKRILDMAVKEKMTVAGMHLPFPSAGMAEKVEDGYRFLPIK
ncbi:MBL fold metallo-hydrolase [Deltaproteobacteria bacterium]|nr:MBL fold metallo-hydrolase [Deltaproteobacteria bacterium]